MARAAGFDAVPTVVVPHPFAALRPDQLRALAEDSFDEIVRKLTML